MLQNVSSKDIQAARRMAQRNRAVLACARCKTAKTRCSDYRPCKRCLNSKRNCFEVVKSEIFEEARNGEQHPLPVIPLGLHHVFGFTSATGSTPRYSQAADSLQSSIASPMPLLDQRFFHSYLALQAVTSHFHPEMILLCHGRTHMESLGMEVPSRPATAI